MSQIFGKCVICDNFVAGEMSQCDIFLWGLLIPDFQGERIRKNRFGGLAGPGRRSWGGGLRCVLVIVLMVIGMGEGVNGGMSWLGFSQIARARVPWRDS